VVVDERPQVLFPVLQCPWHVVGVAFEHGAQQVGAGEAGGGAHAGVEGQTPCGVADEYDPAAVPVVEVDLLGRVEQVVGGGFELVEQPAECGASGFGPVGGAQ
jgi:hypothetical protein